MKGWLLDTNVISEWRKPKPSPKVIAFLEAQPRSKLFTSTVCFAELRRGAGMSKDHGSRLKLESWIEVELRNYFQGKTLDMSEDTLILALDIVDKANAARKPVSQVDAWIAATALYHNLCVVTRDVKDLINSGVPVLNPWTSERFNGA